MYVWAREWRERIKINVGSALTVLDNALLIISYMDRIR